MRTLYLHIGLPKTGSTSLQLFLANNCQALESEGLFYPDFYQETTGQLSLLAFAWGKNHSRLNLFAREMFAINSHQDIVSFRSKFRNRFLKTVPAKLQSSIILSCENLSKSLTTIEELERLKSLFLKRAERVQIIIYLRSQESRIPSMLSTRLKVGKTPTVEALLDEDQDYWKMLELWESVFGPEAMRVRLLDVDFLKDGDLFSDFYHLIGGQNFSKLQTPKNQNLALSADLADYMRLLSKHMPSYTSDWIHSDLRKGITSVFERESKGRPKIVLTEAQIEAVRNRFKRSNEKVRKTYFKDRSELFVRKDQLEQEAYPGLSRTEAVKISAMLLAEQQHVIDGLRQNIDAAKAD